MDEMRDRYEWPGRTMFGADGEKIGKITEIYEDPATGRPEWATVKTGLLGTKSNFVPLEGATPADDVVRARVTKDQVKDAPGIDTDGELTAREERRLFEHYGVAYQGSGDVPERSANRGDGRDERNSADEEREPGGRRLRRYVVTERVIATDSRDDNGSRPDTARR